MPQSYTISQRAHCPHNSPRCDLAQSNYSGKPLGMARKKVGFAGRPAGGISRRKQNTRSRATMPTGLSRPPANTARTSLKQSVSFNAMPVAQPRLQAKDINTAFKLPQRSLPVQSAQPQRRGTQVQKQRDLPQSVMGDGQTIPFNQKMKKKYRLRINQAQMQIHGRRSKKTSH